jgi:hypothetical protein
MQQENGMKGARRDREKIRIMMLSPPSLKTDKRKE